VRSSRGKQSHTGHYIADHRRATPFLVIIRIEITTVVRVCTCLCARFSHLCAVPRAADHINVSSNRRRETRLRSAGCAAPSLEKKVGARDYMSGTRDNGGPAGQLSCTFSVILRGDDLARGDVDVTAIRSGLSAAVSD